MSRSVSTGSRGNMRNGLISLLTLIVVLALATAAVLTVATSRAMHALATRHASMTSDGYTAERSAQRLLALVDDELALARNAGSRGANALADDVEGKLNMLLATACTDGVSATYEVAGTSITCTFVTANNRMLTIVVGIEGNGSYDVESWKLTAAPTDEDTGDTLWTGSTANE